MSRVMTSWRAVPTVRQESSQPPLPPADGHGGGMEVERPYFFVLPAAENSIVRPLAFATGTARQESRPLALILNTDS